MRLRAIEFEGFRGALGKVRLETPHGFLVLSGRNGSGKSTVCDAIEFALTGSVRGSAEHKEKGEGLADYVWWRGAGSPENKYVALELDGESGETLTLRRTTRGLQGIDEGELAQRLCGDTHTLENPLQQLSQVMLLRDEAITRLSVDLKETDRFDLVRAVLGTDALLRYETRAKELNARLKSIDEKSEAAYRKARDRVSDITARLSEARSSSPTNEAVDAARSELSAGHPDHAESDVSLTRAAEATIAGCRLAAEQLSRARDLLHAANELIAVGTTSDQQAVGESLEDRAATLKQNLDRLQAELAELEKQISDIGSENPVTMSLTVLHEHGAHLGLRNNACPLCHTELTAEEYESRLARLQQEIKERNAQASQLVARRTAVQADIAKSKQEESAVANAIKEKQQRVNRAQELVQEAKGVAVTHGVAEADGPPPTVDYLVERVSEFRSRTSTIEKNLAVLGASAARGRLIELKRELDAAKKDLANAESVVQKAAESRGKAKTAYDTIRRMKGELIDERLAELEPLLLDLYRRLRPHCDWQEMRYRLRGDVRRMLSFEIGDGLNPNFVFSSGQRRAAGLAFLLSLHLSAEWPKLDTLILDDPVQHIDDYRALHLIEVLAALRRTGRQVICAVEDEQLAKLLARRLRSQPSGEGSIATMQYSSSLGVTVSSQQQVPPFMPSVLVTA